MGSANTPDILQYKMTDLFHGFGFTRANIDFFILTKWDWTYHIHKLESTINKLKEKGLQCNTEKSFLGQTEMGYFGFWVTRDNVKSTDKKYNQYKIWIHLLPEKKHDIL